MASHSRRWPCISKQAHFDPVAGPVPVADDPVADGQELLTAQTPLRSLILRRAAPKSIAIGGSYADDKALLYAHRGVMNAILFNQLLIVSSMVYSSQPLHILNL